MTYDEFWQSVIHAQYGGPNYDHQRLGQRFYNMLPRDIADVIVGGLHDPFHYDFVTPEIHEVVRRLWDKANGSVHR